MVSHRGPFSRGSRPCDRRRSDRADDHPSGSLQCAFDSGQERAGRSSDPEGGAGTLLTAGWELVDVAPYFSRAADLSRHLGHAIFDCVYLALAEDRGVALVTADDRLFAARRRARIKVQM